MRVLVAVGMVVLITGVAAGGEAEGGPIPVVALARTAPVAYEKDVEPILANKCASCHSGNVRKGKLDVAGYESLMKGGRHGRPVVPGKSTDSLLVRLAGKTRRPFMPPKSEEPLTPQELALLKLWIDQGAKAPGGTRAAATVVLAESPAGVHPVLGVAISPDRTTVVAACGNQVHLYRAGSGRLLRSLVDPGL